MTEMRCIGGSPFRVRVYPSHDGSIMGLMDWNTAAGADRRYTSA